MSTSSISILATAMSDSCAERSFARQPRSSFWIAVELSGGRADQSGSVFNTAARACDRLSPSSARSARARHLVSRVPRVRHLVVDARRRAMPSPTRPRSPTPRASFADSGLTRTASACSRIPRDRPASPVRCERRCDRAGRLRRSSSTGEVSPVNRCGYVTFRGLMTINATDHSARPRRAAFPVFWFASPRSVGRAHNTRVGGHPARRFGGCETPWAPPGIICVQGTMHQDRCSV